jgi:hypothetical protein
LPYNVNNENLKVRYTYVNDQGAFVPKENIVN